AARRQLERQILDQQVITEALAQVLRLDHDIAEARPQRDHDLCRVVLLLAGLGLQLLERGDARLAFRLARARARPDPFQFLGQRSLARRLGPLLLLQALALLFEPAG